MSTFNTELDHLLQSQVVSEAEIIEHLLTHYYADVRHLASNILRDTDEAEDAAQETLISRAEQTGSLPTWHELQSLALYHRCKCFPRASPQAQSANQLA